MFCYVKKSIFLGLCLLIMSSSGFTSAQADRPSMAPKQLPNNASSLNETYKDWQVICQQSPRGARCAAAQQIFNQKSHSRLLNIQLAPQKGNVEGIISVPLGVSLTKGIVIQADDKVVIGPLGFIACVSEGCLARLKLSMAQLRMLQKSKKINVKLASVENQDIVLPMSGNGLGEAMSRLNALMK